MTRRLLVCGSLFMLLLARVVTNAATPNVVAEGQAVHLLVEVQGSVSLKRENWSTYARAEVGTELHFGDLVKVDEEALATVMCADFSRAALLPGVSGIPCSEAQPRLVNKGRVIAPTRDATTGGFPVIITPRQTSLLEPYPTLRWTPVLGASGYRVRVRGPQVDWQADVGPATEVSYPMSAPALVTGETYRLTVTAGGRSSDEEARPGLGFRLVDESEAIAVREDEAALRELGLPEAATQYLIAALYAGHELNAEAIEILVGLRGAYGEAAESWLLGDIYLRIGLARLAEARYLQSRDTAQQAGDLGGEALAEEVLGQIYFGLGNAADGTERTGRAIELYQALGDEQKISELQQRLSAGS